MKIINPLYDKAFKYLMENEKFARKVLSVILDVEVEKVTLGHQETIFPDERRQLTLFRLDFKAVIRQADGSSKTVLIELQKSKYSTDIQRFRNYLGANYISKKKIKDRVSENRAAYQPAYPLILIYILGYNLEEIPYMAITVDREIINSVNKKRINIRSAFIEQLTHQAHIIQVHRLPEHRRTRLEKFLMLFNQAWVTDEGYIIDLQEIPEEFSDIARYLQGPVMDEAFRRKLEAEEELDTIFDEQEAKYKQKIAEAEKREKALARKLALHLKKSGTSIEEIQRETGLDQRTIEEL